MVDRLLRMLCSFVSRTSLQLDPNRFLSSFPNSEARQPRPHHHGDIMMGPKIRCNFRETRLAELRRISLLRRWVNKGMNKSRSTERAPIVKLATKLGRGVKEQRRWQSTLLLTSGSAILIAMPNIGRKPQPPLPTMVASTLLAVAQ